MSASTGLENIWIDMNPVLEGFEVVTRCVRLLLGTL
jgi:hypothetical protein